MLLEFSVFAGNVQTIAESEGNDLVSWFGNRLVRPTGLQGFISNLFFDDKALQDRINVTFESAKQWCARVPEILNSSQTVQQHYCRVGRYLRKALQKAGESLPDPSMLQVLKNTYSLNRLEGILGRSVPIQSLKSLLSSPTGQDVRDVERFIKDVDSSQEVDARLWRKVLPAIDKRVADLAWVLKDMGCRSVSTPSQSHIEFLAEKGLEIRGETKTLEVSEGMMQFGRNRLTLDIGRLESSKQSYLAAAEVISEDPKGRFIITRKMSKEIPLAAFKKLVGRLISDDKSFPEITAKDLYWNGKEIATPKIVRVTEGLDYTWLEELIHDFVGSNGTHLRSVCIDSGFASHPITTDFFFPFVKSVLKNQEFQAEIVSLTLGIKDPKVLYRLSQLKAEVQSIVRECLKRLCQCYVEICSLHSIVTEMVLHIYEQLGGGGRLAKTLNWIVQVNILKKYRPKMLPNVFRDRLEKLRNVTRVDENTLVSYGIWDQEQRRVAMEAVNRR